MADVPPVSVCNALGSFLRNFTAFNREVQSSAAAFDGVYLYLYLYLYGGHLRNAVLRLFEQRPNVADDGLPGMPSNEHFEQMTVSCSCPISPARRQHDAARASEAF